LGQVVTVRFFGFWEESNTLSPYPQKICIASHANETPLESAIQMQRGGSMALFDSGKIVSTPGALHALRLAKQSPADLLKRHVCGDWGTVDDHDQMENDKALREGGRILSSYSLPTDVVIWLITEADRSVTTFLLPSEY
jgi:hypothetical protein